MNPTKEIQMTRKLKKIYPALPPDVWTLQEDMHPCLSRHPNTNGAMLSALFHVQNGDQIQWVDRGLPLQVAAYVGVVNGKDRFVIVRD
jgi:hypothetical protein